MPAIIARKAGIRPSEQSSGWSHISEGFSNPLRESSSKKIDKKVLHQAETLKLNPDKAPLSLIGRIKTFASQTAGKVPSYLLGIKSLNDFTLRYIMQWVLRDPNAQKFNPQIFEDKGYAVEKLEPNGSLKVEKYLIKPQRIKHEPLIVLHGARTSARSLGGCTETALKEGYPVIIGDLAGFGAHKQRFSLETIQDDIQGMLEFASKEFGSPVSILAHSFGTYNAAEALQKFLPENPGVKIKNLVLISPWDNLYNVASKLWDKDPKTGKQKIEIIAEELKDDFSRSALESITKEQLEIIRNFADTEKAFKAILEKGLANRIQRVIIASPEKDQHVEKEISFSLADKLEGLPVFRDLIPNAGHYDTTSKNTSKSISHIFNTINKLNSNLYYQAA